MVKLNHVNIVIPMATVPYLNADVTPLATAEYNHELQQYLHNPIHHINHNLDLWVHQRKRIKK